MERFYYYASPSANQWKVTMAGDKREWSFPTKDAAIDAARTAAKKNWTDNERKSGVRIQLANGQWEEERSYGEDPCPPRG